MIRRASVWINSPEVVFTDIMCMRRQKKRHKAFGMLFTFRPEVVFMLMSWGAGRISRDPPFIQHMVYAAFPSRHFLSFTTTYKVLWVNISGAVLLAPGGGVEKFAVQFGRFWGERRPGARVSVCVVC